MKKVISDWNDLGSDSQYKLVEDLLTIQKKSTLKKRLLDHWGFDPKIAVELCLLEFEPGHSSHSIKAINKLLPFLKEGEIYSNARIKAGYGYEIKEIDLMERLGIPPEIANPIVQKGLHELRRLVNAIIAEYGRPDAIRIEMARDLEMNAKRYKDFLKQQKTNTQANDKATEKFQEMGRKSPHLKLSKYPSHSDKIKYRLWKDQDQRCAYSGNSIDLATLFSAEIDIDHILPYSQSLDDSYMNKVVCYTGENRYKGQRTPIDAFGGNEEKWEQIFQRINRWDKRFKSKKARFFQTAADLQQRDFISSQLNDTRYMSRVAQDYLKQLGADISVSKGITTSWLRHQWGLNNLIGETNKKDRNDHRHHAIDAVVIACVDRSFYQKLIKEAKDLERTHSSLHMKDLHFDPPWPHLRDELNQKLSNVIISHAPQRKLSGALHEETGVGFIESKGAVYRANLNSDFKEKQIDKIIDDEVREIIRNHLGKYNNNPKEAFAERQPVLHKDGKTPIKRVRILQSKTTREKLDETKFGVKNKDGKVFKWLAYGNLHHVEIIKNKKTGKYKGEFVTTMEAHHRAKGIGMQKQKVIKTDHGSDYEFLMALHINDLVSVEKDSEQIFYRIQKLDSGSNRMVLRLHTASTLGNKDEEIYVSINEKSFTDWNLKKLQINVIGKIF